MTVFIFCFVLEVTGEILNVWFGDLSVPSTWQAGIFNRYQDTQPLEYTYIRSRPKRLQPAEIVAYQGRQYIIFSLNAGNGNTNETSSTGIWSWMEL